MPILKLHQWMGEDEYEFFDTMSVTDDQWEKSVPSFSLLLRNPACCWCRWLILARDFYPSSPRLPAITG